MFIRYGILANGVLARCCGDCGYSLTDDPACPEWLTENPEDVSRTMFNNCQWYNSEPNHPCWGGFLRDQLRPAKVVVQVAEATPDEVPIPDNIRAIQVHDLIWYLARKYAGNPDLPSDRRYVGVLIAQAPEFASQFVDQVVCCGNYYHRRKVIAAIPLPSEYPSNQDAATLLICEAVDYPGP